jgi:hypothetical protein
MTLHTEKNKLFEGVLYQYFEGTYYERCHRRNITISITILFVGRVRKKFAALIKASNAPPKLSDFELYYKFEFQATKLLTQL